MRVQSLLPTVVATASAVNLYVSSYSGTLTSLSLTTGGNGTYSLTATSSTQGCGPDPSWLTLDSASGTLYCSDENIPGTEGSVASYSVSETGVLTPISRLGTIGGPVSSVLYNDGQALAQAHYGGSSVTTFALQDGQLQSLENFTYTLDAPGPRPDRQAAPYVHQVVLDPTGSFIAAPDLGADLVRVFSIDKETSRLTAGTPLKAAPGSGPRHATFLKTANATYFYLLAELANTLTTYSVTYGAEGLSFNELSSVGTYGNRSTPAGAAAAEILLSPDQQYILTSSRNDTLFQIDNFDSSNSTKIASDTLQSWWICPKTGQLTFKQLTAAGGRFPRQFSVNADGTLAAVGLQRDGRVVILERNVDDGTFGKFVASVNVEGEITSVVWDE